MKIPQDPYETISMSKNDSVHMLNVISLFYVHDMATIVDVYIYGCTTSIPSLVYALVLKLTLSPTAITISPVH